MFKNTLIVFLCILSNSFYAQTSSLEKQLNLLEDIRFSKIRKTANYEEYIISIKQPINHFNDSEGYFYQKIYLSHRDFESPTVMVTAGYNVDRNSISEIASLLDANQIIVEHRYFGESIPETDDYQFLNLKQATADLHRINTLFKALYNKKWISTGISKGGTTSIFYKYFYPNDVAVSVPYVAPINKEYEESRIYDFLKEVGSDTCRETIFNFQTLLLKQREELLPLLKFYSLGASAKYNYLSLDEAFEYAVMEYPFSFWQWGYDCDSIPDETASIENLLEHFINVADLTFFSDASIRHYASHYYQAATEMGYYGYETKAFKPYLKTLPTDKNPMALFFPFDMKTKFDSSLLKEINQWLDKEGHHFIYIYGEIDTWSACAVPPNENLDSVWFFLKGKDHANARIKYMTLNERTHLVETLEQWLDLKI